MWSGCTPPFLIDALIHYPYPWKILLHVLQGRRRSFHRDAEAMAAKVQPPIRYIDAPPAGDLQPCIVTINHYHRPGFSAWWLVIAISKIIQPEIHWVVTAAWRFENHPGAAMVESASRWLLRRIARVYGFTTLPPAPPHPADIPEQARAIRWLMHYVETAPFPLVGFAPEGGDFAGEGELALPPPGAGRLVKRLADFGLPILPAGIYEHEGALWARFGTPYRLAPPPGLEREALDDWVRGRVMEPIAELTAFKIKGVYDI